MAKRRYDPEAAREDILDAAERLFAEDTVVERYECILTRSARHEPIPADCSWPTEIPPSALMTVARWAGEA